MPKSSFGHRSYHSREGSACSAYEMPPQRTRQVIVYNKLNDTSRENSSNGLNCDKSSQSDNDDNENDGP